ncbi:MAG: thiamine pyrophosphate-dependent enzyme [Actinobacteria bacterium]|nr:thiamine pyrophosphate-dependent enzyme [Actinomycetota bacterium]
MTALPTSVVGPSRRSIADDLVSACREVGTTHVFGVPGGGSNLDVVGAAQAQGLEFVLVHTETAAAIMAGVMAELTGAPGLCLATRGPGAASAVNGVAQALLDRQPLVVVTDCVAANDRPRVSHQRLDQPALMGAVSKASIALDGRDPGAAQALVALALEGRPGPVHVDIDPSAVSAVSAVSTGLVPAEPRPRSAVGDLAHALELVGAARRPVVIVGIGAVVQRPADRADTAAALADLGNRLHVPVLCTYKARGMVADGSAWCAGVATGATIESPVLQAADLIIGVGLDPVELIPAAWSYDAPVVLCGPWAVDDSSYFGDRLAADVVARPADAIAAIAATVVSEWAADDGAVFAAAAIAEVLAVEPPAPVGLVPQQVVTLAAAAAPDGTIATVDAGAHMLVAMPLWPVAAPCELLISSGLATMGFALPAAIAAALARPGRHVVCFTGDGGLGMVLAELETVARLHLPIVVVVFDDASLSLIAAKQQPEGHGGAAAVSYRAIDFAGVAAACGLQAERVSDVDAYERALTDAFAREGGTLVDVTVDPSAYGAVLDAIRGVRIPSI